MVKNYKNKLITNQSLYNELNEFYKINKNEPYTFQDFYNDGKREFEVLTYKKPELREYEKNRLSYELLKTVLGIVNNEKNYDLSVLEGYLALNPIINYIDSTIEVFSTEVQADKDIKNKISILVEKILLNSPDKESIKFGLSLVSILDINNLKNILDVFSIHNSYLFYVIKAYKNIKELNYKIFEKAKMSHGYGRVFCVEALKICTPEIQEYFINEACDNEVGISELIEYTFLSMDLYEYLETNKFDKEKIESFSKFFEIVISDYGLDEIKNEVDVCNKIIDLIQEFGGGIYSLYNIISILYCMENTLIEYYKEHNENKVLKCYEKYQEIIRKCLEVIRNPKWNDVIYDSLQNIEIESTILVTCMEKIGFKIEKNQFENILKREYKNPLIYKYGLNSNNAGIRKLVISYSLEKLSKENIISAPKDLEINNVSYDEIEHVCYFVMIKYSKKEDFKDDEYKNINIRSLKSPLKETRIQCIKNLKNIKDDLSEADKNIIAESMDLEPCALIKSSLKELLDFKEYKLKKSVPIYDIDEINMHAKDIYLDNCILSQDELDISDVYNKLEIHEMVYLILEENNESVLVCTYNGHVIGYLKDSINTISYNLIRNDKYLYGKIESIEENYSKIIIGVYLSYRDVVEEIEDTLTLLSLNKNEYIQ